MTVEELQRTQMNHNERKELARLKATVPLHLLDKRQMRRHYRRVHKAVLDTVIIGKAANAFLQWLKQKARYHGK